MGASLTSRVASFAPIASPGARVLILGSMPGRVSLEAQSYYAHPRNLFWSFMEELAGVAQGISYDERLEGILSRGIALWDVVRECRRDGSLDANIARGSVTPNDFTAFFTEHPRIVAVFFNGQTAARFYHNLVFPTLDARYQTLHYETLPSTSPANASLDRARKLTRWMELKVFLD